MIKKDYLSPVLRLYGMTLHENFCVSMGTDDITPSDPVDWDWDNA